MTGESERVEGQALAAGVLEALDGAGTGGAAPDWTAFVAAYGADLNAMASGLQRRYRGLQRLEPAEIVQAFLAVKVFPPQRARVLFGVAARGEQPLRPRLLTSLGTYCVDLHRGGIRRPSVEQTPDLPTAESQRPTVEEVEAIVARQLAAIRAAFERAPTRAPYRGALLLSHRGEWVWVLSGVVLAGSSGHGEVTLRVDRVVALTAWSDEEAGQLLGDGGAAVSLRLAWDRLSRLVCQPSYAPTGNSIAAELDIPRERWDGWVSRGRHRLKTHIGEAAFGELFPTWVSDRG